MVRLDCCAIKHFITLDNHSYSYMESDYEANFNQVFVRKDCAM